jgi:hypothetical protein
MGMIFSPVIPQILSPSLGWTIANPVKFPKAGKINWDWDWKKQGILTDCRALPTNLTPG